ncbi:Eco57I restriction-modification methylase domain-containing protein [Winogradskyella ursingii]|uniref:Eco57I restriction-modification methylase domain-containing protein n=1 Tax=Winogradskyella ursingii TaxID=2686079 RepID=UPI0015CECD3A|nr:N-6 DNA methylase [Winogradskyella ursingii]
MSLFQNSVLNKYLKGLESEKVNQAYERFTSHFHNPTIQENIRNSKEEQYQGEFLIDLFVNVFGYVKNPTPDFNLTTELKNIKGSKKTDGAILKGEKALAVIELKGTNTTDLSKVETQAFGYKNNQPGCNYVITSNFEKLRFYIDNAVDFEEFNLFQLSKERFDILWLCVSSEYLLKDIPKKIKDESLTQEENVTKKLYKDYASFRNEIFDAIQKENPEYDKLTLFKKTQKLLDRFLFIFFAEDRLLLPPNSIRSIVNQWTDLRDKYDEYFPLYDRFKKYFGYMNTGHKGQQHDIFAYNGGLFAPDEILDNIKINDDLLYKHTVNLSNYDFESEVSVNILGHIFEHSLNDIDEIQAEIQGVATEQSKTKRKKDGVFYTPKYITKYIVDRTVGKLCEEKKTELDIQEAEYEKERRGRQKTTLKKLTQKLEDYRNWLLQITICDPACGSGAFLNQALEFLIAEHQYIDELQAKLFGDAMILSEVENSILENNIYGVDINEESVEIAKLSLWLRTAQKGRKLTSLNNNIKCGNSLINDPTVAGEKAFNWQNEFPEVFAKGGFDIVIGNPPYVKARDNDDILGRAYIEKSYKSPYKMWDLYVPFIEKGIDIVKEKGLSAMIIPDTIGKSDYTTKLIELIDENYFLYQIDFFPDIYVFQNVGVRSKITFIQKEKSTKPAIKIKHVLDVFDNQIIENKSKGEEQYLLNVAEFNINRDKCITLADLCYVSYGMRLNSDKSDPEKFKKTDLLSETEDEIHSKIYTEGKYLERYSIKKELFLEYNTERSPSRLVRPTFPELYPPNKLLLSRQKKVAVFTDQSHYCDNTIIMAIPAHELISVNNNSIKKYYKNIGKDRAIIEKNSQSYDLNYLLGIINSKLISFHIKYASKGKIDFYPDDWKELPIFKANTNEQNSLSVLSKKRTNQEKLLENILSNLLNLISAKFQIGSISRKLQNWNDLEFIAFLKELKKQKCELNLSEEAEWMQYFNEQKDKAQNIKREIYKTESEIDQMVYELYGLSENEIKIVENANA